MLGVSARAMLKALIAGAGAPDELAELAQRRMRRKRAALGEALTGRVTAHHRFMLEHLLRHIEFLDDAIATCDRHIATLTAADADALARLDTIPGVARRTAEIDRRRTRLRHDVAFPTAGHAASWAGLCPGNHESAGKRLSGRTRFANRTPARRPSSRAPAALSANATATSRPSTAVWSSAAATRRPSSRWPTASW